MNLPLRRIYSLSSALSSASFFTRVRQFLLMTGFLAVATSSGLAQNAAAVIEEGVYEIKPLSDTTKALDVGVSKGNGDNVKQWESGGNANQRWEITAVGDGYYRVSPLYDTNMCLDASGTTKESTVRVWTYEGKPNQQWQFFEDSTFYEIAPRSILEGVDVPPLRLDVVGGRTVNNANVQLYTDNNTAAQRWYLDRIGNIGEIVPDPVLSSDDGVESSASVLSVYPNPARSQVTWQRSVAGPATLSLYSLQGQLIKQEVTIKNQGTFATSELSPGLYVVSVYTETQQFRQRLLIE